MTRAALIAIALAGAACGPKAASGPPRPGPRPGIEQLPERVVYDFERAVLTGRDEFLALFDFTAVGEMEILLHRYDALGRYPLSEQRKAEYLAEDGTPYPPDRERRNIGGYYPRLIQPAIAQGRCRAIPPASAYDRQLGVPFEPLPPGHEAYEPLRVKVNDYLEDGRGGVIGIRCPGGSQGLALVYTKRDNERGYDLITIYEDDVEPRL